LCCRYRSIRKDNFYGSFEFKPETLGFGTEISGFPTKTSGFRTKTSGFSNRYFGFFEPKLRVFQPKLRVFENQSFVVLNQSCSYVICYKSCSFWKIFFVLPKLRALFQDILRPKLRNNKSIQSFGWAETREILEVLGKNELQCKANPNIILNLNCRNSNTRKSVVIMVKVLVKAQIPDA
jgi:hypothetical protein